MTKIIYSRKMAVYLRNRGCKIVRVEANPYKPEFDMWIFEDTQELRNAMNNFMK